jgi:hypothetical protein
MHHDTVEGYKTTFYFFDYSTRKDSVELVPKTPNTLLAMEHYTILLRKCNCILIFC